ncbi:MAG TPA: TldD/PmbA family protein [Thermoplasmata archaeon]|nr:TldD/PmbA family protein [Thermoplasmata archaeon]
MTSLRSAEDDLARALQRIESKSPYAEAMAQATDGHSLRHDRSSTTPEPAPQVDGTVFRAWAGDGWREVAVTGYNRRALDDAAESLLRRLGGATITGNPPGDSPSGSLAKETTEKRPIREFTLERRLELARTFFGWATSVEGIGNAVISIGHSVDERLLVTTSGARRYQRVVRARASVAPLAIENGKVEYDFVGEGESGGAEVFDRFTQERILETAREAKALLHAGKAPTGRMAVVLDPSTAGTFAHESFGHGTEADQLLRDRSYLKPILGQHVGPESLTLVDDGSFPNGWGTIYFDDEGHVSQRTVLVDHGRFVEVLHDRESAAVMGRRPTGNTRRADFLSRPFVRMTNTFVEPGDWTHAEMIREAKEGILLEHCTSGIEDPLGGNMQIKVKKAHRIEHGEVGELLPSMALSGKVLEFLKAIRGVSRKEDFEMSPGYCGKGHTDLLPAGTGGPYLLSEAVVGPA